MKSGFERYIAVRYFRGVQGREEGRSFIRFVLYIAVGGVAVGVATLLLALAIVRGFKQEIEAKIVGFGAHVQVENFEDAPISGSNTMYAELAEMQHVTHVAPVVLELTLLRRSAREIDGVALWGTDVLPSYLREHVVAGDGGFAPNEAGQPGLVIGSSLADKLGLQLGDKVTAFSMRRLNAEGLGRSRPRIKQFHIAGIYTTSLEWDELYVFADLAVARTLLEYDADEVTRFDLMLDDVQQANAVAFAVEDQFGFPIMARSIYDVYRPLFAWVRLQENIIPLVLSIITIVAAFNIIGTLLMLMLEKTQAMGILASMGASAKSLRRLFLWMGVIIGGVGTLLGSLFALVLGLLQQQYGLIPLPADAYYMDTAPVDLVAWDFVIVGVIALTLCVLAAYLPARVASRIEPIRVIRFR